MIRAGAICLTLCCMSTGCNLLGLMNRPTHSKPPQDEVEAHKWWQQKVDSVSITTLQCWYHASEFHRLHGSSAEYVHEYSPGMTMTMAGPAVYVNHYPAPIPVEWLPRVQARLAGEKSKDSSTDDRVTVDAARIARNRKLRMPGNSSKDSPKNFSHRSTRKGHGK